jgi:dipeptidyl aminopeptidase/acylaminoacyl peptidase
VSNTAPYGSWLSAVTSDVLVEQVVRLGDVVVAGEQIWWNEGRPAEAGRQVLVSASSAGTIEDRLPAGFSARSAVHEYGGNSYALLAGGADPTGSVDPRDVPAPGREVRAVFVNWADQRLWLLDPGQDPVALTPEPAQPRGDRYADLAVVPGGRVLLAVRERHLTGDDGEILVHNEVVALSLDPGDTTWPEPVVVASGHDFYAAPRPSPDGRRLAWICWDHPSMPWDATELWVAELSGSGEVHDARRVAGGAAGSGAGEPGVREAGVGESVVEPVWSPDGRLHYVSDRSGWWNIYDEDGSALAPLDAEFSSPLWQLGQSSYVFLDDGRLIACASLPGGARLGVVSGGAFEAIDLPFSTFSSVRSVGDSVVCVAGSPTSDPAVVRVHVDDGRVEVLRRSRQVSLDAGWLSAPVAVTYPTTGGRDAHALWYPPKNPDVVGPVGDRPPLVVMSHGGPTSAASPTLNYGVQYWTSRGFGVVDVDYGGSSGYGRTYRDRLRGQWGIVDVDDCVAAARWLADQGLVDGDRMVIRGGSAGGYTTLAALTFRDVFAAGASHYGVADLELLARDTHKFESRYLDGLIGPYPEALDVYHQRSPIHHVEGLTVPLILFQGLEDAIVPPAQAELIARALTDRGVPVAYLSFPGEQHGFRQAATITRVIDTELHFYGRVLGFVPAGTVEPFVISNEDALRPV